MKKFAAALASLHQACRTQKEAVQNITSQLAAHAAALDALRSKKT